jgi:hypothetical protein
MAAAVVVRPVNVFRAVRFTALAMAAIVGAAQSAAADDPAAVLHRFGLEKKGRTWCLAEEVELQRRLAELEPLERRFHELRQQVEQIVQQHQRAAAQLAQAEAARQRTRQLLASAAAGSPQRKPLEDELKRQSALVDRLKRTYVPLEKQAEMPLVRSTLVEWIAVRNEIALTILECRNVPARLPGLYHQLRNHPEVMEALASLGSQERLGPAKTYQAERRLMDRLEQQVLGDVLPVYVESGHYRLPAILNEQTPATFSYLDSSEPAIIPATLAEAAGITVDPSAEPLSYRVDQRRTVAVRPATIPRLRLGGHVLRNVEAYVLPPDAEDLGARIGHLALGEYRITIEPQRLECKIEPPQ